MPPKDSIRPDTGTIYFAEEGETLVPLGGIQEATFEPAEGGVVPPRDLGPIDEWVDTVIPYKASTAATFTVQLANATEFIRRITYVLLHPRVAHFAKHGKNKRIRKKNIKRIMRGD